MRHFTSCALTRMTPIMAVVVAVFAGEAAAQYPMKPVRIIVSTAAGSSPDIQARIVGQKLIEIWGRPLVVENIPGVAGNLAAERVARSAPDGYTLMLASFAVLYINKTLYSKLGYDIESDFEHITQLSRTANLLVVHPSLPARTVRELVALGRSNRGIVRYGSGGSGTSMHLCAAHFASVAGIEALHVPYRSSAQMAIELVAGQFEFAFHNAAVVLPLIKAGKLRGLAVTTPKPFPFTPELPTMEQAGVPGVSFDGGLGLVAPKGTPVIETIYEGFAKVLKLPAIRDQLAGNAVEPVSSTPKAFSEHIKSEIARWAPIVRATGAKVD